jgi:predicted Zn-dependent peptidase
LSLANGAKGLLVDIPDSTVMGIELNFRAGDFLSPKNKWEVAHILEHMVFGANKEWPRARAFQAEFQKNGAYMNASTSSYNLNYITECADFEWDRILALVKLSVESPLLSDEEFKAELGNVREELVGDLNQNFRQVIIKAREKFGLVALSDQRRIELLDNIRVEDIRDYYKKTHHSANLRFVIAGNLGNRMKTIESSFAGLDLVKGVRVELPAEEISSFEEVYYIDKPDLQNLYFFLNTYAHQKLDQKEDDSLGLVNTMLTATLTSRILGEARERGLAYNISSSFTKQKDSTGWWFGAELTPQNAMPVFEIIKNELGRLLQGVLDDDDFEAAKQYSLGRYQRSAQTVGGVLAGYAGGYFYDERIDDYYGYPDRIKAVTKSEMVDSVKKMFSDRTWGLTIMGTEKSELATELNHQISVLWE